ncbi:hypothetical protein [Blastococcus sp. CCUG 61487]|uniref:hypothetical protein n=1 Tax=Blastococcus sp. CCUG 61487 TaxID=1840703 RepID=UPI0010C02BE1|nr:hypothetical protein [Blastococcus sp. CCUG 61487]TKJ21986.1 hypothetical protein A6V29_06755 [Blastococcus sp. CCUG 61487]
MTLLRHGRRLRAFVVLAFSGALLAAGCDADGQPPLPDKSTTQAAVPAVAGSAGEPGSSAGTTDWKGLTYGVLDCYPRDEWIADGLPAEAWDAETVQTTTADVTGDGVAEVLVQVTCPGPTSTRPDHVVVFDPTAKTPRLLGVLGDDLFHPRATVTTDGSTVILSGETIAGDDPYCCPGHWGVVTYSWNGVRFVVTSLTEAPGALPVAPARLADGVHVGMLHSVGDDELTVDLVEWFEGEEALAACRQDGVQVNPSAWCTEYYARNDDGRVVLARVSDSASLSYLDLVTMREVSVRDVAELAGTYWVSEEPDLAGYSRIRVEGGVVTELESIYTP